MHRCPSQALDDFLTANKSAIRNQSGFMKGARPPPLPPLLTGPVDRTFPIPEIGALLNDLQKGGLAAAEQAAGLIGGGEGAEGGAGTFPRRAVQF